MSTIPNVIIRWCRKKAKCRWCEEDIEVGQPEVMVMFWNKGNEHDRSWNKKLYYHFPECYVSQGEDYLKRNPFVPHRRGRKSTLSQEDRRKRYLLVRRFHSLVQRKDHISVDYPDRLIVETDILKKMTAVANEMLDVGGVPPSWAKKFT